MKIRTAISSVLLVLLTFLPGKESHAQRRSAASFTRIDGFRPKTGSFPSNGFSTELYSTKQQFENKFEKIPGSKTGKASFENKAVVACCGEKTNTETNLSLEKVQKRGEVMEVYFKAVYGKQLSSSTVPCCLYNIQVDRSLSGINYYINGKLVQELRN
jgi:hypothetical protein